MIRHIPAMNAFAVPAPIKPPISSVLVIGVSKYPSCSPLILSSMYVMPPPIIAVMKIPIAVDPASRYLMYSM